MTHAKRMLDLAARLALRAEGDVEPNPMVGCVICEPGGRVIGLGRHRRFGGPHAEVEALADCARRGERAAGATVYVTLEPCNGHGKQPPCADALIAARVAKVVAARHDPNPPKAGGAARLRAAGIEVEFSQASPLATGLAAPFAKRVATGLPWAIAKWAQTIDGKIATRTGESKWISGEASRRAVHRLRARVDAILVGIGTVKADDPMLTARGVARVRRIARRVVLDPGLELPPGSALARTARDAPVLVATTGASMRSNSTAAARLEAAGVEVRAFDGQAGTAGSGSAGCAGAAGVSIEAVLRHLAAHGAASVLVEGGAGVLGRMLDGGLVDEARVFIAPMLMADPEAPSAVKGRAAERLADVARWRLCRAARRADDLELWYRR
jgi:diaminohydroxyphosphoribosylaminopyrimidine deaminase/5-amino-6-(5-phosphoribosylamino)uracil reductase